MTIMTALSTIRPLINRIAFSLPITSKYLLKRQLEQVARFKYKRPDGDYHHIEYLLPGSLLTVRYQQDTINRPPHARIYVTVFDPTRDDQLILKELLQHAGRWEYRGRYGVLVTAFEVTFDLHGLTNDCLKCLHNHMIHHFVPKRMHAVQLKKIGSTWYFATNGNIRKGQWGIRAYIKQRRGEAFYRLERQFNRRYIQKHDITVLNLPIEPHNFEFSDLVLFLQDFNNKGIKNLTRNILRKSGINESVTTDYDKQHFQFSEHLRREILTYDNGRRRPVCEQIEAVKLLKKKHGLTMNHMLYFEPLIETIELLNCHAAIGFDEPGCTKRICFAKA